jgi:uncharacterized membrane protein (UPF0127 family)
VSSEDVPAPELPDSEPVPSLEQPLSDEPRLSPDAQMLPITAEVELNERTIGLEVARTPQQQATGLMARDSLADDRGMLFPFEPARPVSFWMKNVRIPLDMVFIHQGEVVAIADSVPPCTSDPCQNYGPGSQVVDYVLELRGGLAAQLEVQVGDPVEIRWLEEL